MILLIECQDLGLTVSFFDKEQGCTFHRRFDNYLEASHKLEADEFAYIEGNKISLTVKGKRLSGRRARRAKFGIPF